MATFVQHGDTIDYTPDTDVSAGEVVTLGQMVGIATRAIQAGMVGALRVHGVFDMPKPSGSFPTNRRIPVGSGVLWTGSTCVLGTWGSYPGAIEIGRAVETAETEGTSVRVLLKQ